ncbi:hypothetical protein AAZX31_06G073600 [Glycine max]|uniref:Calmodulin-binding domain-containing protein n=2 Tax=Glycine subgen. Soja TaxID=1462606 RepID=K7KTQ3_SOYBN|nr:uncharacterized protein At1g10890 [Glycine max]XP_028234317.1 uncharacterized protein At1g10890-like [Glycine soja]KAG5018713.1 hypothetical protein JHK87_014568 [Glycine soja]KAG5031037.1 hypothetical protein JHK85_015019 [Glycine max]KAG5045268.1 hypothetical protein JHK86_014674 [Glycine max]KAG5147771.1 hypothetical protein JHK82_014652 [Glycine max]KAH1124682.1 hypothetical protein GYH30_014387 [Glycine max]|eukprot:XP_006582486.1 uncharacterized protein At1g10890 [Glycine max]
MATKAKETSVAGKEKKAQSSNSPMTSTKKIPTKASTTSSTNKATSSPSEKQVPNYLKPTISSLLDSHSSFKLPRNDAPTKPTLNRRRSLDPSSSSRLQKHAHTPSLSRQNKALVSPGPRERTLQLRSSSVPIKTTNNPSKPIPERLSKTPKEGRIQPLSAKKSNNNASTSTSKKVISNDASANSTNFSKSSGTTAEAEEAINEEKFGEVKNVENHEEEPSQVVGSEHEHDREQHGRKLDESDQPHVQDDDEKDIPTVPEEKKDENTNQDECNINEIHPEIDHSTTEEVEAKEEEQEQEREESGVVVQEDHKSEPNNEEEVVEERERVEEVTSEEVKELREGQNEDEQVESEFKEEKVESPKPKQVEEGGGVQEKKEAQSPVSNDVIEEDARKQLEARRNKVRALAGAFQNVIDHQKTK